MSDPYTLDAFERQVLKAMETATKRRSAQGDPHAVLHHEEVMEAGGLEETDFDRVDRAIAKLIDLGHAERADELPPRNTVAPIRFRLAF